MAEAYSLDKGEVPQSKFKSFLARLECAKDPDATYENDRYTNRDLIPIPKERRTWGVMAFFFYWLVQGNSVSGFTIGASLLAYGLTPGQSLGCVACAGVITGLTAVTNGWIGTRHHIGFTVGSRFTWGMRGTYVAVIIRCFFNVFWFGLQAFWGAQAMTVCITAIWPSFRNIPEHIPASSGITTPELVCVIIFYVFYCIMAYIPPERLVYPFVALSLWFFFAVIGMLAWAVSKAGGGGPLWSQPSSTDNLSLALAYGISVTTSLWATGMLGQADLTRYSKGRHSPTLSQLFAAPICMTLGAAFGIICVSASASFLPDIYWSPGDLLNAMLVYYNFSSGARAGAFFAGGGVVAAQLAINVIVNSVSVGMDISGLWPKWINIRRGQYLTAVLGLAVCPWELLVSATTFYSFLNGSGIFIAPMMGLQTADYFVVRRVRVDMHDIYTTEHGGIYWFWRGYNWRAVVSFLMGCWPGIPGLAMVCQDATATGGWVTFYTTSFFSTYAIAFVVHIALNWIWTPEGVTQGVTFVDDWVARRADGSVVGTEVPASENEDKIEV